MLIYLHMKSEAGMSWARERRDDNRPFAEKLLEVWRQKHPEIETVTDAELRSLEQVSATREAALDDLELVEALEKYGIELADLSTDQYTEVDSEVQPIFRIPVKSHFSEARLPEGYGYAGGAARSLLLRNLGVDSGSVPRDIDVVRLVEDEPEPGSDRKIALAFMPDDFSHGHGVRNESDRQAYFDTRDLTINQILATDHEIFATRAAVLDTVRHVLRPTQHETAQFDGRVGPKVLAKMLRLYSDLIHKYDDAAIELGGDELDAVFISGFYLAVQLDKAVELSYEAGQRFVDELISRQRLPVEIRTVEDAANYFLESVCDFHYRHAPTEQFEAEDALVDEYEHLAKSRGKKPRV